MTPAARLSAAIGILDDWLAGMPVEQALTRWSRGARYAGSGDRAAVRDHVFDVLRARGSCAAWGGGTDGRALVLGLVRMAGDDPEALFTGIGHAAGPLSEAERALMSPADDPSRDVPDWLLPPLGDRAGDRLPDLLHSFRQRAPLYLRVALRRATREQAVARLAEDGVEAILAASTTALEVVGNVRALRQSTAYLDGLVEPQDLSVQLAVEGVAWQGPRILDFCAGGGGKALAIADRIEAEIFAHDVEPRRMADLPARARRAGVRIVQLGAEDVAARAPFETVLCDVPCSGSGTWRRDPEAKWRLDPQRLNALCALQDDILDQAAGLVRSGGFLVYMTCSLFRVENEDRITAFLARHPGWRLDGLRVFAPLDASDGFFSAVLQKSA